MNQSSADIIKSCINYNRFPNFLIVGANKGGTTSVHNYCQQHPEILMSKPVKEPMFFTPPSQRIPLKKQKGKLGNPYFVTDLDAYQKLFVGGAMVKMRGEASTSYLASPGKAIPRINAFKPDMKIIGILREPISRAVSAYNMYKGANLEHRTFDEIVQQEYEADFNGKQYNGRRYLMLGRYSSAVIMYTNTFGPSNVLFCNYSDLKKDSAKFMKAIYSFLTVDTSYSPDLRKLNVSDNWVGKTKKLSKRELSTKTLRILQEYFKQDISKLKDLNITLD